MKTKAIEYDYVIYYQNATKIVGAITFACHVSAKRYSYTLPADWFFKDKQSEDKQLRITLCSEICIDISFVSKKIRIHTAAEVNICLNAALPLADIEITTRGKCEINVNIWMNQCILIAAQQIFIKKDIYCQKLRLITPKTDKGIVQIDSAVHVSQIICVADILAINKRLVSELRSIECNFIKICTGATFANSINSNAQEIAFVSKQKPLSKLVVKNIHNQGELISIDEIVKVVEHIHLFDNSFTNLERAVCDIKKIAFAENCNFSTKDTKIKYGSEQGAKEKLILAGNINLQSTHIECYDFEYSKFCKKIIHLGVNLFCQNLTFRNIESITGKQVAYNVRMNLDAQGDCNVNGLYIQTKFATINSVFDGGDLISFTFADIATITGLLYAKVVSLKGKMILVRIGGYYANKQFFYKNCYRGGIAATQCLNIKTVVAVRIAGSYFSAPKLLLKTGINLNVFGLTFAYDYLLESILNSDFSVDLPLPPDKLFDLLNLDKLSRLAYRMAKTCTKAEYSGLMSMGMLAATILPTALACTKEIGQKLYQDPNVLNHLWQATQSSIDFGAKSLNAVSTSVQALKDAPQRIMSYEEIVQALEKLYCVENLLDIVDCILTTKGLYIKGSSIHSHAKRTCVFACEKPDLAECTCEELQKFSSSLDQRLEEVFALRYSANESQGQNFKFMNARLS